MPKPCNIARYLLVRDQLYVSVPVNQPIGVVCCTLCSGTLERWRQKPCLSLEVFIMSVPSLVICSVNSLFSCLLASSKWWDLILSALAVYLLTANMLCQGNTHLLPLLVILPKIKSLLIAFILHLNTTPVWSPLYLNDRQYHKVLNAAYECLLGIPLPQKH